MFQIRRAVARALTQAPIKVASKQVIQCRVQRSIVSQVQSARSFSQVRPCLADEKVPIEHEAIDGSDAEIREHASATAESTDTVSEDLEPASRSASSPGPDQDVAAVSETTDQVQKPQDASVVFVANLPWSIDDADLREQFGKYGRLIKANVTRHDSGTSRGFGFVTFQNKNDAETAVSELNGREVAGRQIIVQISQPRPGRSSASARRQGSNEPSKTLFIGNMSFKMSDADLNELFRDIKNVIDVRVAIDRRTGAPRGFAHADFATIEAAVEAKALLEGKQVLDRTLTLDFSADSATREARSRRE